VPRAAVLQLLAVGSAARKRWWSAVNRAGGYSVEPFSSRYWWTRDRLIREICEQTLSRPDSWLQTLRQPRLRFYDERVVEYSWALATIAASPP